MEPLDEAKAPVLDLDMEAGATAGFVVIGLVLRRVAWLCGKTSESLSSALGLAIYPVLRHLTGFTEGEDFRKPALVGILRPAKRVKGWASPVR